MQDTVQKYWPAGAEIAVDAGVITLALIGHPDGLRIGINADGRDPIPMLESWLSQHVQH